VRYVILRDGREIPVEVTPRNGGYVVTLDGRPWEVDSEFLLPGLYSLLVDGKSYEVGVYSPEHRLEVSGAIGVLPAPWQQPTTRGLFLNHWGTSASMFAYNYPGGVGDPIDLAGSEVSLTTYVSGSSYPRLFVRNDGNVGVGTSNPTARLQVEGPVLVNGPGGATNAINATTSGSYSAVSGMNSGSGPGVYAEGYSTQSTVGAVMG